MSDMSAEYVTLVEKYGELVNKYEEAVGRYEEVTNAKIEFKAQIELCINIMKDIKRITESEDISINKLYEIKWQANQGLERLGLLD